METKTKTKKQSISEGLKKYHKRKKVKKKMKQAIATIIFLIILPTSLIGIMSEKTKKSIEEISNTHSIRIPKSEKVEKRVYGLGVMEDAMIEASEVYNISLEVFVGIANAESTLGKNFYNEEDKNCYNWWGIRKVRTTEKGNTSWLKCYRNEREGAMDFGRIMRNYYFDQGLDTPDKIIKRYVGSKNDHWLINVKKYWK